MSFLSFNFAVFLAFGLLLFHLGRARWRPAMLLALSYAFYLSWGVIHTLLLAAVTVGVYATALWIEGRRTEQGKRALTALGVMTLLLLLFAFKSSAWFVGQLGSRTSRGSLEAAIFLLQPLGLSYYVFKMLGYLLDVYWEQIPARRDFVSLALYGSFFPQIVSGPVQRASDFFSQLDKVQSPDAGQFVIGLRRILFGLLKKVVIADRLAPVVEKVHAGPTGFSSLELLFGAYCYSFQLYADFSGLTDIAIGLGQLFGVKGPENFDLPYFSPNIQVFWRRWHMSLTSWLTDYLFMPLRMSLRRLGTAGLCLAIFINMIAIGIWHGLAWNYAAFGLLNGVYMAISVLTLKRRNAFFENRPNLALLRVVTGPLLTFHLVVLAQIFFRARGLRWALSYIVGLVPGLRPTPISAWRFDLSLMAVGKYGLLSLAIGLVVMEAINWAMRQPFWIERFVSTRRIIRWGLYYAAIIILLCLYTFEGPAPFLYARF
jgi:alginate O-acetyltransferase complex protein AlgI